MKKQLIYIADTYCIWCYAFNQTLEQVALDFENQFDVTLLNGGMIQRDITQAQLFSRFPNPEDLHAQVTQRSGVEFGEEYLQGVKGQSSIKRILNSTMPARAILAFKHLGLRDELTLAHSIQDIYYRQNLDLQELRSYEKIADKFGVNFVDFETQFRRSTSKIGVQNEYDQVRQLSVQGYPAVLLLADDGSLISVCQGFLPYNEFKANLELAVHKATSIMNSGENCALGKL